MERENGQPISVRLPADLKAALRQVATWNERSLNKEIVVAIRAHVRHETTKYTQREEP